jgi:hypothetical protein
MAQSLEAVSVASPGFFGLNTQQNGLGLDASWASEAYNCIISKDGGIESRMGWIPVSEAISGNPRVVQINEYINGSGITELHSCTDDFKIWKGTTTLTDISPAVAPTGANWKLVNFNNNGYGFQTGQSPIEYNGTGVYTLISAGAGFLDSSDAVIATMKPNECLAGFGRLWVADTATNKMKVWWSDALLGRQWSGGSSGTLDLRSVLTKGMDTIVALRAWNGNLVIFLTKNILIYSGASVPSSMVLVENIVGIGCIARDSIQEIGTDIVFLSDTGIRSLGRSIQEKSLPVSDFSRNVRDQLRNYVTSTDLSKVRSGYSEDNAFYLLTVPNSTYSIFFTFCVDLRRPLDDGSYRVTVWSNINPTAIYQSRDNILYLGLQGYLGKYSSYLDNTTTYRMTYYTTWLDFAITQEKLNRKSENYGSLLKFPKKLDTIITTNTQTNLSFKWYFDFSLSVFSSQITTPSNSVSVAEYNVNTSEYNITEFTQGNVTFRVDTPLFGSGKILKLGIESDISGAKVEIQRLDILAKLGRMT